jgi:predicted helicase
VFCGYAGNGGSKPASPCLLKKNVERVERQKKAPITIVIGNPPYNANQANENDNNKNRKYDVLDQRVKDTYTKDSRATNRNKSRDPYTRFFRWATDRLEKRDGIVCFVSNNSYLEALSLDGMRKHLASDFQKIQIVDLQGNIRKDSMRDGIPLGEAHTVFGLAAMVGIAVGNFIKKGNSKKSQIQYDTVHFRSTRQEKFDYLTKAGSVSGIQWTTLKPDAKNNWFEAANEDEFADFVPIGSKEAKASKWGEAVAVFSVYSNGIKTNRDAVVYDPNEAMLAERIKQFVRDYNAEVHRFSAEGKPKNIDTFVDYSKIDWSRDLKQDLARGKLVKFNTAHIRKSLYRPFCRTNLYFDPILNEEVYRWATFLPTIDSEHENTVVGVSAVAGEKPFVTIISKQIPNLSFTGFGSPVQCFPFYVYNEDGSGRRENITDWALGEFRGRYASEVRSRKRRQASRARAARRSEPPWSPDPLKGRGDLTKWDIFYYVYGILHHPEYRARYADNLKRELPRIPFAPDFWAFSKAGKELSRIAFEV